MRYQFHQTSRVGLQLLLSHEDRLFSPQWCHAHSFCCPTFRPEAQRGLPRPLLAAEAPVSQDKEQRAVSSPGLRWKWSLCLSNFYTLKVNFSI